MSSGQVMNSEYSELYIMQLFHAGISRLRQVLGCPEILPEGEEPQVVLAGSENVTTHACVPTLADLELVKEEYKYETKLVPNPNEMKPTVDLTPMYTHQVNRFKSQ